MVSAAIDTAYLEIHFPLQKKKKKNVYLSCSPAKFKSTVLNQATCYTK